MLSLEKYAGVPFEITDDLKVRFGSGVSFDGSELVEHTRLKNQLKNSSSGIDRREVYQIFHGIAAKSDQEALGAAGLSYDLIIVLPGRLGDEFVKTRGYGVSFPEIYEIVYGSAYVVLQEFSEDMTKVLQVYLVELKRGDKLVVLPRFGINLVNVSNDILVLSRLRGRSKDEDFEFYDSYNGAAYYVSETSRILPDGKEKKIVDFTPNLNYDNLPELLSARPRELPQFNLLSAIPLYFTAIKEPDSLAFLNSPGEHDEDLKFEKVLSVVRQKISVN